MRRNQSVNNAEGAGGKSLEEEADDSLDELVGLMGEHGIDSCCDSSSDDDDHESTAGAGNDSSSAADGVQAEVDMFMAKGGYQVTYIGSVPVSHKY